MVDLWEKLQDVLWGFLRACSRIILLTVVGDRYGDYMCNTLIIYYKYLILYYS